MTEVFHLSIGVRSLQESVRFFTEILGAGITHADPSGYVNLELARVQLTLKETINACAELPEFHFGINTDIESFEQIAQRAAGIAPERIVMSPTTVDAGTPLERRKMYLRCPTGYLIEVKGRELSKDMNA